MLRRNQVRSLRDGSSLETLSTDILFATASHVFIGYAPGSFGEQS